jgi:hypothetical protein
MLKTKIKVTCSDRTHWPRATSLQHCVLLEPQPCNASREEEVQKVPRRRIPKTSFPSPWKHSDPLETKLWTWT